MEGILKDCAGQKQPWNNEIIMRAFFSISLAVMSSLQSDLLNSRHFKGVSRVIHVCYKVVSKVFQGNFKDVWRVFQGSLKEVSRMFQGCFNVVSWVSHT